MYNSKNTVTDEIKGIKNVVTDEINDIRNTIKTVTDTLKTFVTEKILSVLKQIDEILYDSIIRPLKLLMEAIGNVFVQLFNILMEIGDKIKSLPGCSGVYMFQAVFNTINAIYEWIVPSFLVSIFSTIYAYTLKIPVDFISYYIGYDNTHDKCYKFDVGYEVDSIKNGFNQAANEFKTNFGKFDLSTIQI